MRMPAVAVLLVALAAVVPDTDGAPTAAAEDVVHLRNGDRVSGRIVAETPRLLRLQTPFGRLNIPRARIARLVRADGREETFEAWDTPSASVPREPALILAVTGRTFWYAWDRRSVPERPALRLRIEVDGETMATYLDTRTDPEGIRGAVVNAFAFPDVTLEGGRGAGAAPPEVAPGRILLRIELPARVAGKRRVRLVYEASGPDGAWQAAVSAETEAEVRPAHETPLDVRQDMGTVEYTRRQMRNLETITLQATASAPRPRRAA